MIVRENTQLAGEALPLCLNMGCTSHGQTKTATGTHGQPVVFVI
jgi:hypothetical protein